jgi:tetratricopeptide (TPR) repeat protein
MRGLILAFVFLAASALPAAAQFGKQIAVQVGTPEDHDLTAIQAAADLHQKLALLDKFAASHPTGDMALMADNLYVDIYSSLKQYSKAYAFGDKALALDPTDLNVAVELIRDAQLQSNTAKMVAYCMRVGQMVSRYKSQPPPAGTPAAVWAQQQQQVLAAVQPQVSWVVAAVNTAISSESSSTAKAAMQAQMDKAFPKSSAANAK